MNKKLVWLMVSTLCLLVVIMALSVIRGWLIQDAAIVQIRSDFAPMQFNTALCFALTACAIWFYYTKSRWLTITVAIPCFFIAAVTELQYLLEFNTGLDTLLLEPFTVTRTSHPGRMAPNTALNFILLSASVLFPSLLSDTKKSSLLTISVGAIVSAIALIAIIGFGTGLDGSLIWGDFTRMALHTAFGFLLLGIALLAIGVEHSGIENIYELQPLPYIASGGTFVFTVLLWLALQSTTDLHIQSLLDKHDEDLGGDLGIYLDLKANALMRLAKRTTISEGEQFTFEYDASTYLEDFDDLVGFAVMSPDLEITDVFTRESRLHSVTGDKLFSELPAMSLRSHETWIDVPIAQENIAYIRFITPRQNGGRQSGYVIAASRLDTLFRKVLENRVYPKYLTSLYVRDQLVISDDGTVDPRWQSKSRIRIGNANIDIVVRASPMLVRDWQVYVPVVFLIAGIILSLLVGGIFKLMQFMQKMAGELSVYNEKLHMSLNDAERARQALEQKSAELAQSNRDLENFASIASHDLSEPLRKVGIFGERLSQHSATALDDKGRQYLEVMVNGAERMQALLDSLLAYSRVTSRGQAFAATDLNNVLRDVLSDLAELVQDNKATVNVEHLPTIQADYAQMRQLFQNLIANAIRYHKEDVDPEINIRPDNEAEPGSGIRIIVSDNGIGFAQEYAEQIFEVFKRLHTRGEYPGTGMGLAVCKRIMERHNGQIRAEGEQGAGARFILEFPV